MKEAEVSHSAFFITLTYENAKITENGFMTLVKADFQKFMKRLRKLNNEKLVYYAVGEYGGKTNRPHYHAIIFNSNQETISKAWKKGQIHIGSVNERSVGYTLKYISKEKKPTFNRDDREPEFSLMSKGIGKNYLTNSMKKWHYNDLLNRMYCVAQDGIKIPMPRYYKDKLYTKRQLMKIGQHIQDQQDRENAKGTYQQYKERKDYEDLINKEIARKVVHRKETI